MCTILLQVLIRQQPDGKNRATSFDEATLFGCDGSDVLEVLVQYPLKYLLNFRIWVVAALTFPEWHSCAGCSGVGGLVLSYDSNEYLKTAASHSPIIFQISAGMSLWPVCFPFYISLDDFTSIVEISDAGPKVA